MHFKVWFSNRAVQVKKILLWQKSWEMHLSAGLEIISRLAPVKLSGQTYFCSDTTHFWPDKSPLRHISTKFPPSPCSMMFTYQTSTFSKPLLYMEPRTHCRKSGMHGTATTFGKINITFVHASIASVLCLLYR